MTSNFTSVGKSSEFTVVFADCRFILHAKKTAFVVEHDFIMATYLADRVVVFEGTPAVNATART